MRATQKPRDMSLYVEKYKLKSIKARLIKTLPQSWHTQVLRMVKPASDEKFFRPYIAQREAFEAFEKKYADALHFSMHDGDICDLAKRLADDLVQMLDTLHTHDSSDANRCDAVQRVCETVGVPPPKSLTVAGMVERARSPHWWRRVLRKQVARVTELGAIELGLVSRAASVYASNDAVQRRRDQLARNAATLKKSLWKNEAGQVYSLAELASKSIANQDNRRDELMTRIRGADEFAKASGHLGYFLTLTCPSRKHAVRTVKNSPVVLANDKYDGSSPKDAQAWLCARWASVRAAFARAGIMAYGLRVAEAHHDGTPHWHAMLFVKDKLQLALARMIIRAKWLAPDAHEIEGHDFGDWQRLGKKTGDRGADMHRVKFLELIEGQAAGYVAKYISKNINSNHDVGKHLDEMKGVQLELDTGDARGAERVDAWASTWGIRQFQFFGLPPIGVWRALRGVSRDQVKESRDVPKQMVLAFDAVHRMGDCKADFLKYINAMGGACVGAGKWALRIGRETLDKVNGFGEAIVQSLTVGVEDMSGRLYVSRRMGWVRVVDAPAQNEESRAALALPWTRFNNCTARLTGGVVKQLFGRPSYDSFGVNELRYMSGIRC